MKTPKLPTPLKFGEVEWTPFESLDEDCRCKTEKEQKNCDGMCSQRVESVEFANLDTIEDAAGWEFAVSKIDGAIVMAKAPKGER